MDPPRRTALFLWNMQEQARLEDVTVWEDSIVKQTKKGEKKYGRWLAGWREGGKLRKVYLGTCEKMSQGEALQKARVMKAETLDKAGQGGEIIGIGRIFRHPPFL
jgi:hypothetical protein